MSEATQQQSIADCPYCQKSGLPILPLRYAVTRTDSESGLARGSALSGPFGEGVTDISLPEGQTYTLRLVRGGYLYLFNEMRGSWSGYIVTERGYLFPYVAEIKHDVLVGMNPEQVQGGIDALLQPPTADEEFTCTFNPNHHYPGRCITIPDADQADNIYLAFSDTAWTKRVWHEHATNAQVGDSGLQRRDHMRKLSLAEWRSGSARHAAPMAELEQRVAEADYPWLPPNLLPATLIRQDSHPAPSPFGHSSAAIHGMDDEVEGLVAWAEAQAEPLDMPPLMVALDDPVGIAADIAGLMGARREEFMRHDHLQRPLAISAVIATLQESIRNQAELRYIKEREDSMIRSRTIRIPVPDRRGPINQELERQQNEHYHKLETDSDYRESVKADARQTVNERISTVDLEDAANDAWSKYQDQLVPGQPETWKQTIYQKELEKYDEAHIIPLARAHQEWLRDTIMWQSFACNHDDADGESGAGYIQALLLCIQDTQQIQLCFDNYVAWLSAPELDNENILQRALSHNQKKVLDAFNGVDMSSRDIPYDKWNALIGLYNESLKHVDAQGKDLVAQLVVAVGGPVVKVLDSLIDRGVGRLVISLGLISRAPVSVVQHTGTVSSALDVMVRMMKELNPEALGDIDSGLLKRRLEIQTRGQRREVRLGQNGQGRPVQQVQMRIDRFAVHHIDGEGLEDRRLARLASGAVLEMDEWPDNQMARFRTMFSTDARLAAIGLLMQAFATYQLAEKLDEKSMSHQGNENIWRFRASWGAILSGVANVIHDGIVNGAKAGGVRLGKIANRKWFKYLLGTGGRVLGLVTAGLMAFLDFKNMIQEVGRGHGGMAILYLFSGAAGALSALLLGKVFGTVVFGLSSTGVGLLLVVVAIGVSILIDFYKNNALQDWMERCHFGKLGSERYGDLEVEMGQLDLAIKSLAGEAEKGGDDKGEVERLGTPIIGGK